MEKSKFIPIRAIAKDRIDFSANVIPFVVCEGNFIKLLIKIPIKIAITTDPIGKKGAISSAIPAIIKLTLSPEKYCLKFKKNPV